MGMILNTIIVHEPGVVVAGGICPFKTCLVSSTWFVVYQWEVAITCSFSGLSTFISTLVSTVPVNQFMLQLCPLKVYTCNIRMVWYTYTCLFVMPMKQTTINIRNTLFIDLPSDFLSVSISEVRRMDFFHGLDWNNLLDVEPPFVPNPDDATDTSYFDGKCADDATNSSFFDGKKPRKMPIHIVMARLKGRPAYRVMFLCLLSTLYALILEFAWQLYNIVLDSWLTHF